MSMAVSPRPSILRNERGTSVIELAVAAPVLLLFVAGLTDLGRGLSERYRLQQAVNRSLEMAQTGRDGDYAFLVQEAAAAAGVPEANVVQQQWLECDGVKMLWTEECNTGSESARYVKLTIRSSYRPLFGSMGYLQANADGSVDLSARATLRVR